MDYFNIRVTINILLQQCKGQNVDLLPEKSFGTIKKALVKIRYMIVQLVVNSFILLIFIEFYILFCSPPYLSPPIQHSPKAPMLPIYSGSNSLTEHVS